MECLIKSTKKRLPRIGKGARRLVYHTRAFENRYEIPLRIRHTYRRGQRREMDIQFNYVRPDVCNNRIFDFAFHANVRRASRTSRQLHRHRVDGVDNPAIFICTATLIKALYYSGDNEILLRFPVNGTQIFIAKSIFVFISNFLITMGILLPFYICYGVILQKRAHSEGRLRFSIPWRYSRRF